MVIHRVTDTESRCIAPQCFLYDIDVGSRVLSLAGTLDGGLCGLTTAGESSARTCWPTRPCSMFCFVRRSESMFRWLCISRCAPCSQCSCAAQRVAGHALIMRQPHTLAVLPSCCSLHARGPRARAGARQAAGPAPLSSRTRPACSAHLVLVPAPLDALVQRLELTRLRTLHLQLLGGVNDLQLVLNLGLLPRLELIGLQLGRLRVCVPVRSSAHTRQTRSQWAGQRASGPVRRVNRRTHGSTTRKGDARPCNAVRARPELTCPALQGSPARGAG